MPNHTRVIRVAWVHPLIAHYRLPVIEHLGTEPDLEVVHFAGQARMGVSADDASAQLRTPAIPLKNIRFPPSDARVLYAAGWSQVLRGNFDVVITTEASHNITNWLLLALKRLFRFRLLIMGHIRPSVHAGFVARHLRRALIRGADGVIAYTQEGAEQAASWGIPSNELTVMGNTLDVHAVRLAATQVTADDVNELRTSLGLSGLTLVFLGRPTPPKRPDVAIDTLLELYHRGVDAHLLFIGDSTDVPGLKARAKGNERIHFLGALYDESQLAAYMRLADMVFVPGAVGLTVVHAFAYGVPLLTSAEAPHRPEMALAKLGVNSLFTSPGTASDFANEIERLSASPQLLEELTIGARATELNSAETMAASIASAVRKSTAGPRAARHNAL